MGRKISKEEDERSKSESPKESSPKWVCQRNILTSPVCFLNSEYALFSFMNILVETISLWVLKNVQLK